MAETSNPQADGAAPDPERPGAGRTWRIGKYEILRELGRGAMGQVYEARHPVMGKTVAIKVFRAGSDLSAEEIEHNRQRLIDEGRRAGALSHPHIVTIHDVDVDVHGDLAYVVMEFVAGPSLEEWLKERGTVDPAVAVGLLQQVAGALDYAHSKGIIHRDIKPANILIAEGNQAKVADFGIAKSLTESTYTKTGTVLGTPFYMSPEQIVGTTLDGRSDQFSLGVIAYRMLAGHRPFDAESITSLLYKIVHEEPPSPATFNPKLSPASVSVLARALAKQPERRYASCTEFAASLQRAVAGGAVPPVSPASEKLLGTVLAETIARLEPRHRNVLYYALVPALILVLGLAIYALVSLGSRRPKAAPAPALQAQPVKPAAPLTQPPVAARRQTKRTQARHVANAKPTGDDETPTSPPKQEPVASPPPEPKPILIEHKADTAIPSPVKKQ